VEFAAGASGRLGRLSNAAAAAGSFIVVRAQTLAPRGREPTMNRSSAVALALSAALAACGSADQPGQSGQGELARAAQPRGAELGACPPGPLTSGIDVSSYQGAINWGAAADSGVVFAIAKATEGLTVQDADFAANWAGMKSHGVIRGAYHFFHGNDDGAQQADQYLAQVGTLGEPGDLPPMLDWEANDSVDAGTYAVEAQKFIDEIKAKTGLDTVVYTYPYYWTSQMGAPAQFAVHPLWLAAYNGGVTQCPSEIAPWSQWTIWQWSGDTAADSGTPNPFAGVAGEDLDVFAGSAASLRAWASPPIAQASGNDALTAVNWPDGHAELFGRSPAGAVLHVATGGSGDDWGTTDLLAGSDGGVSCGSAAAFWGGTAQVPELFSALASGASADFLYSGGSWGPAQPFGGSAFTSPSAVVGMDGKARVFALGGDGAIWMNAWSASSQSFSGWSSQGGSFATGAGAISWGNGTIELFAADAQGALWHRWSTSGAATAWSSWTQMGSGIASRPAPVRWSDGTLGHAEIFARGSDGQLYHSEFSTSSGWPAPSVVSAGSEIIGSPSAFINPPGAAQSGPEVVARDASGRVLHLARAGSGYGAFAPLGEQIAASDPFGWIRGDGTAEVFAVDSSGALVAIHRDASGDWGSWSAIGSGFDRCAPALASESDGGAQDGGAALDAGGSDPDAGSSDAGALDAGGDAGALDAGSDAGSSDAGPLDAGVDGGPRDAGADAGPADAGAQDGGLSAASSGGCSSAPPDALALLGLAAGWLAARRRALEDAGRSRG